MSIKMSETESEFEFAKAVINVAKLAYAINLALVAKGILSVDEMNDAIDRSDVVIDALFKHQSNQNTGEKHGR